MSDVVYLPRRVVQLVDEYLRSGGTYEKFKPIADAIKSPNRVAALQALLDAETDPAMRRGLRAGIAEAQRQEAG